jgi:hypothetical protein
MSGLPESPSRPLTSWGGGGGGIEPSDDISEALQALETYKRKDPSKGEFLSLSSIYLLYSPTAILSGSTLQSGGERADNEAELL